MAGSSGEERSIAMHSTERSVLKRRFILFQLLAFASFASMNYYNVYLKSVGFDSIRLGIWASITSVIGMVTLPLWGVLSDCFRLTKAAWILSMAVYGVCYALLPVFGKMPSPLPLYAVLVLYSVVKQPTHSLQDAWSMDVLTPHGIRYTEVRGWGSFGFAVTSILFSFALSERVGMALDGVFFLTLAMAAVLCVLVLRFREPAGQEDLSVAKMTAQYTEDDTSKKEQETGYPLLLFRNYEFAAAFIMVIALAVYSSLTITFYAYILEHAGLSPNAYGRYSGIGAFVQMLCMALLNRFGKRIPPAYILAAGGFLAAGENLLYSAANGNAMMLMACTLWGFEMAINVSVLPAYLHSLVPPDRSATAQTLSGTAVMLFSIVGSLAGGVLVDRIGISAFTRGTAVFQAGMTCLFLLTLALGRRVRRP